MTMIQLVELALTYYGPLAAGWLLAIVLLFVIWRMMVCHRRDLMTMAKQHRRDITALAEAATEAVNDNTAAISALTTRIGDWVLMGRQNV